MDNPPKTTQSKHSVGVVDIDDDNEPAPENVTQQGEVSDRVLGTE